MKMTLMTHHNNQMKMPNLEKIKKLWESFIKDPLFLHKWDHDRIYSYGNRNRNNRLHENIYHGYSHDPFYLQADSYMFIEDVHTGVMPFIRFRRRSATDPKFTTNPTLTPAVERMVAQGISGSPHTFDLSEACSEFIRNTAQHLMVYGHVDYELIYQKDGETLQSFSFDAVPDKYFYRIFGNYYQIIPWWVAQKAKTRAGIIKIPADKVLRIKFPKELGGKKHLRKILARMHRISKDTIPPFALDSIQNNEQIGFDSNEYSKSKHLEIARLTKDFGWNQRARKNDYTTEFHFFKRHLDSRLADIVLRESILKSLNEALNNPVLNLGFTVQMDGFVTREQIEVWRKKMSEGGLKFMDIFNDLKER